MGLNCCWWWWLLVQCSAVAVDLTWTRHCLGYLGDGIGWNRMGGR